MCLYLTIFILFVLFLLLYLILFYRLKPHGNLIRRWEILLKRTLESNWYVYRRLILSGQKSSFGHFEHGKENSRSIKRGEFLGYLRQCKFFSDHTCQLRVISRPDFMSYFSIIVCILCYSLLCRSKFIFRGVIYFNSEVMIWCCSEWSCCLAWNNKGDRYRM